MKLWKVGEPETAREVEPEHPDDCAFCEVAAHTGDGIIWLENEAHEIRRCEVTTLDVQRLVACEPSSLEAMQQELGQLRRERQ